MKAKGKLIKNKKYKPLKYKSLLIILITLILFNCKNESKKQLSEGIEGTPLYLKYAKGFTVEDFGTYKVLEIISPWPKADKTYRFALLNKDYDADFWSKEQKDYDETLEIPIKKSVVTSTTHIPALELLDVEQTLLGFPGTEYISSKKTRKRIDDGFIRELGKNEGINTEVLLELEPDVVIGFGVDGNNRTFETIKKSGIPVIFNGDWVEESPLAKAEWIKFFGVLFNKEKEADSIFNTIEKEYLEAKALAKKVNYQPTILSGAMHNDIWFLPNGTSTEAQLLKDANTNYLWKDSKGTGSLSLNFESVYSKAKDADIWLSPSNYISKEALRNANSHHAMFNAFKNNHIYSSINTTGTSGGILYFEMGVARPDLVLKDLIKICHPELLKNYDLYFFKKLD
ncbi:iron complex transport system substrate-binding protein [Mariniflexile fucanivorans]|uniref:Iron complex transport system substrate-binding protein n=1 Tax=Mariniflexile fucanivorans TaxID=264023 RepID=A0A4R1REW7_9FLAO|nr:ABC transporter substrate-binding protein [Mariniflexile fucanivorans]TCL64471.1 iron complex transport system substrate-binding protein [Mariniflexile fucanivorans]